MDTCTASCISRGRPERAYIVLTLLEGTSHLLEALKTLVLSVAMYACDPGWVWWAVGCGSRQDPRRGQSHNSPYYRIVVVREALYSSVIMSHIIRVER